MQTKRYNKGGRYSKKRTKEAIPLLRFGQVRDNMGNVGHILNFDPKRRIYSIKMGTNLTTTTRTSWDTTQTLDGVMAQQMVNSIPSCRQLPQRSVLVPITVDASGCLPPHHSKETFDTPDALNSITRFISFPRRRGPPHGSGHLEMNTLELQAKLNRDPSCVGDKTTQKKLNKIPASLSSERYFRSIFTNLQKKHLSCINESTPTQTMKKFEFGIASQKIAGLSPKLKWERKHYTFYDGACQDAILDRVNGDFRYDRNNRHRLVLSVVCSPDLEDFDSFELHLRRRVKGIVLVDLPRLEIEALQRLLWTTPNIKSLSLLGIGGIAMDVKKQGNDIVQVLVESGVHLPLLLYLDIDNLTNTGLLMLPSLAPNLKELVVRAPSKEKLNIQGIRDLHQINSMDQMTAVTLGTMTLRHAQIYFDFDKDAAKKLFPNITFKSVA